MLTIIINAYACAPRMGSEPGMAWNWCVNLANYCELHIITEGEFWLQIETALLSLPQAGRMHFHYNPLPARVRQMCWDQGDWRFYAHYRRWQQTTYKMARQLMQTHRIDLVHQLNMIGFREPGYLWRLPAVPFIWGPCDAKEAFPTAYLEGLPFRHRCFYRLKNILTGLQLRFGHRIAQAAARATVVVAATIESQRSLNRFLHIDAPLINETGCYPNHIIPKSYDKPTPLQLLWVGKLDVRKLPALALSTVAQLDEMGIRVVLHLVGGGNDEPYRRRAIRDGIADRCVWHGCVSHEKVQQLMQSTDLLFFTGVAEGTPHVVIEAIANGLPVICFDCCGQADAVTDRVGLKLPLSTVAQSISTFAERIAYLSAHREVLRRWSAGCLQRQNELSWAGKARQMYRLYRQALGRQCPQNDDRNSSDYPNSSCASR